MLFRTLLLAAIVATAAIGTPAFAVTSPQTCVPTFVGYSATTGNTNLAIKCGGNTFMGWNTNTSGCTNVSTDTTKMWMSLAQAALLSGQQIDIVFSGCSGYSDILEIDLL